MALPQFNIRLANAYSLVIGCKHPSKRCLSTRACPHFKNGDKNEINYSQTRKIAQIISRY